jgi:valyl-tRNA synthetase
VFCDHYLEAVKHRLYAEGGGKAAAQSTLYYTVRRILQLLAPVMPHITEEIYNTMYAEGEADSIHLSRWPEADDTLIDHDAEKKGDLIVAVIRDIRREKNRLGVPLNTPLLGLSIHANDPDEAEAIALGLEDISATVKADEVEVFEGGGGELVVEGYPGVRFSVLTGTGGT